MTADSIIAVPVRPLFSWAEDEALMKKLKHAKREHRDARINLRRCKHGEKTKARKRLQKAVHQCLIIENEIAKRSRKNG